MLFAYRLCILLLITYIVAHTVDFRPFSSIRLVLSPCMPTCGEAFAPLDLSHNYVYILGCSVTGDLEAL